MSASNEATVIVAPFPATPFAAAWARVLKQHEVCLTIGDHDQWEAESDVVEGGMVALTHELPIATAGDAVLFLRMLTHPVIGELHGHLDDDTYERLVHALGLIESAILGERG